MQNARTLSLKRVATLTQGPLPLPAPVFAAPQEHKEVEQCREAVPALSVPQQRPALLPQAPLAGVTPVSGGCMVGKPRPAIPAPASSAAIVG